MRIKVKERKRRSLWSVCDLLAHCRWGGDRYWRVADFYEADLGFKREPAG